MRFVPLYQAYTVPPTSLTENGVTLNQVGNNLMVQTVGLDLSGAASAADTGTLNTSQMDKVLILNKTEGAVEDLHYVYIVIPAGV